MTDKTSTLNKADTAAINASIGSYPADPTVNVQNLLIAAVARIDDLRRAESERMNEIMTLRADYSEKLSIAESKRIDAIRAVDVNAVAVAAERAAAQAQVLANQVAASADTLRALVAATATTIAQQLATLTTQLTDRISALEKSQYTSGGISGVTTPAIDDKFNTVTKTLDALATRISSLQDTRNVQVGSDPAIAETLQTILKTQSSTATEISDLRDARNETAAKAGVVDPAIMDALKNLNERVTSLAETRSATEGKTAGGASVWSYVVAGVGVVIAIITLAFNFFK